MLKETRLFSISDSQPICRHIKEVFTDYPFYLINCLNTATFFEDPSLILPANLLITETIFYNQNLRTLFATIRSVHPPLPILLLTETHISEWVPLQKSFPKVEVLAINAPRHQLVRSVVDLLKLG